MSETEEPPAKVIKIDKNDKEQSLPELSDGDNTSVETLAETSAEPPAENSNTELVTQPEEGQEEWLSEGVLTDDDYQTNAANETTQVSEDSQTSQTNETANLTSEPPSEPEPQAILTSEEKEITAKTVEQNIEETLNQMNGKDKEDGLQEDLDAFLEKNSTKTNSEKKEEVNDKNQEVDDGNDTDDLLRMLGEDDNKAKKKLTKTVKDLRSNKHHAPTSDEEDFEYDKSSVKRMKAAKSAIAKKTPPKAVPEDIEDGDDDDTGLSSDEEPKKEAPKKKQYNLKKPNILAKKLPPSQNLVVVKKAPEVKQILNVVEKQGKTVNAAQIVTKQVITKPPITRSILKTSTPAKIVASTPKNLRSNKDQGKKQPPEIKTPAPFKSNPVLNTKSKEEPLDDEKVEDEELPYDDEEADSEFQEELNRTRQRIMKPEQMDEEIPSDGESHSDDGSLYDELPSSDSEDMDDWFQIDIRGEKASGYLPLLGSKARELLLEEKQRVSERIANLRQSLSALTESGKRQAEHLRAATMDLAEIDDLLKAT